MLPGFFEELWMKDIRPSRTPLRDELDPVDGLAISIGDKGVLQPLVVRPAANGFEVVSGNRRLRACRKLGLKKVPCYVLGLDPKQAYEASLIENLQRRALNPLEEARAFKRYVDDFGYGGVSELARRIGKSQPYVSRRLALLNLPKEAQEALVSRQITPGVAEELAFLDPSDVSAKFQLLTRGDATRSEVRKRIDQLKRAEMGEGGATLPGEAAHRKIRRAMSRSMASLKVCMMQIDDAIDSLDEDEWPARRDALIRYRSQLHQFIDEIIAMQKREHAYSGVLTPRPAAVAGVLRQNPPKHREPE